MGYCGFGMRKDLYTRVTNNGFKRWIKPKNTTKKRKQKGLKAHQLTHTEINQIKKTIQRRIKRKLRIVSMVTLLILCVALTVLYHSSQFNFLFH